jgi:Ca-activated chloride channel homolog
MRFLSPSWLLLLVVVGALLGGYVVAQVRRKTYVARFSNVALLGSVAPRRPGWRRHLTFALLLIGLSVLSVGVARPAATVKVPLERATVMMAVDVSLSMEATDVLPTRIQAAKSAAKTFVDVLPPRINLGLVAFGGTASVLVSPTVDRNSVKAAIDAMELQQSTAIGEAVFASLGAINVFAHATTTAGQTPPPARIVLLSDGANNKGRTPDQAASAARQAKVTVSTIAFGTDSGTVTYQGETIPVPADKDTLSRLAQNTGGSFHVAASAEELRSVYANIGSQVGYTKQHKDISWRFLVVGVLFTIAAAGASLLWAGRLV